MSFFAEARFISSDWVTVVAGSQEVDEDEVDDPVDAAAVAASGAFERDEDDDVHDLVVVAALDDDDSSSILESPSVLFGLSLFIEFQFRGTFRRAKRHRSRYPARHWVEVQNSVLPREDTPEYYGQTQSVNLDLGGLGENFRTKQSQKCSH